MTRNLMPIGVLLLLLGVSSPEVGAAEPWWTTEESALVNEMFRNAIDFDDPQFTKDDAEANAQPEASLKLFREDAGGRAYEEACAYCHYRGAGRPDFDNNNSASESNPEELIRIILFGVPPVAGKPGLGMPGFAAGFSDADVASIASHLRVTFTDAAAWVDLDAAVDRQRLKSDKQ